MIRPLHCLHRCLRPRLFQRRLTVLAIETSWCPPPPVAVKLFPPVLSQHIASHPPRAAPKQNAATRLTQRSDDTSVAVLHTPTPARAELVFLETITSANGATGGIHPLVSLVSHREHLAPLLARALPHCRGKPDMVAVTRGPGMAAALAVGLDTAKGLAVALDRPLVGVHHMLAHALTPRLVAALGGGDACGFPFATLLVSGGHTLLARSRAPTRHRVLADTLDIALGDMLDKAARALLPAGALAAAGPVVVYGRLLEQFCFPDGGGDAEWAYHAPGTPARRDEAARRRARWGDWALPVPLARARPDAFSFAGLGSALQRVLDARGATMDAAERRALGREFMVAAFEHVASRAVVALRSAGGEVAGGSAADGALVVSGGVAANGFLRHVLQRSLAHAGLARVRLVVPPARFCTDQAAMVAWAAAELWRAGWRTALDVQPLRRWSLDDRTRSGDDGPRPGCAVEDGDGDADGDADGNADGDGDEDGDVAGGVLGVSGWVREGQTNR